MRRRGEARSAVADALLPACSGEQIQEHSVNPASQVELMYKLDCFVVCCVQIKIKSKYIFGSVVSRIKLPSPISRATRGKSITLYDYIKRFRLKIVICFLEVR